MKYQKYVRAIELIFKRPLMYVPASDYHSITCYLHGFLFSLNLADEVRTDAWMQWTSSRFNINSTAWGWSRIILHSHEDESAAIDALPGLLSEFFSELESAGVEGILSRHREQFRHGERVPFHTRTSDPNSR